ncbi:histidinol phosphatase, partial [bacterium]|nr:histidinol phosphatase [bacterium]
MFQIFSKKVFLVDLLEGFVDMHNHLLPGIDDGAKTVKESITMIKGFAGFGVQNFIATPHIMYNYYPNTTMTINAS